MHPWKANYRKPMGLNCRGTTVAKESLTAHKTTQIQSIHTPQLSTLHWKQNDINILNNRSWAHQYLASRWAFACWDWCTDLRCYQDLLIKFTIGIWTIQLEWKRILPRLPQRLWFLCLIMLSSSLSDCCCTHGLVAPGETLYAKIT